MGHSVGELGCAYADGGLTAEETVLAAYWRGRCVTEAKLPPGGMAAVGKSNFNSNAGLTPLRISQKYSSRIVYVRQNSYAWVIRGLYLS